ncbi:titin [Drosophila kikkawai]|uniref:Titin n=1 Tax=Drosophila kikkawai TaxID=30033 RepID=A0A6P4IXF9_DROKI|nr:uncharacterized protein LOC108078343 [Drosophila kikkawai]
MVVCTAAMPMEARQQTPQTPQTKDPPRLMDGPPGGQGQGGVEEDDREEGEIVDDFEMIISSEDEEFKLRARIQQLEENNKDVERMDMLSANLANQYNYSKPVERDFRYQHKPTIYVLSDVSSQSDNEFLEQRKHRRHKIRRLDQADKTHHRRSIVDEDYRRNPLSRRTKHKQLSPSPPPLHRRRQGYNHHQQRHFHQQQHYGNSPAHHQEGILLESLDSATDDDCDVNIDSEDDEVADLQRLKLSRHKLRVALALEERQEELGQYKNSLKERLERQNRLRKSPSPKYRKEYPRENNIELLPPLQVLSDADAEEDEPEPNPHQQQQEQQPEDPAELRLRLIALKSAILRKHQARKKRDAERAYSPTDMINRVHPVSNDDDIDDLMEISPAASPERIPSPPRFLIDDAVDTKPVDMELAETDSDDQHNAWDAWSNNWNSMDHAGGSWRCFMPNSLPPVSMPIVIDEEDEEEDIKAEFCKGRALEIFTDDEVPPPPPPFHIPHMHLEDEDARDAMHLVDQHSNHSSVTDMQSVTMDNSQTRSKSLDKYQADTSDDEAGALRAMLLSNLRPNKPPLPPPPPPAEPSLPPVTYSVPPPAAQVNEEPHSASDSDDPEELRSLLLSSIATKKRISHPQSRSATSPLILKNAVRRFQPIKDEEALEDQQPVEEGEDIIEPKGDEKDLDEELPQNQQTVDKELTEQTAEERIAEPSITETASPISMEVAETPQPPVVATQKSIQATQPTSSPSTKIIKIVKPNKVINKMTTTKRKLPMDEASASGLSVKRPTTLMIKEPSAPLHRKNGISSSTRLITTMDPASIKVNKLVISLGEESAASDDDLDLGLCSSYASYADIASPLSLTMGGSPSGSTTRSNTPISEIADTAPSDNGNLRRTLINEYFEKKIDDFLRQARSKAPASGDSAEAATTTTAAPEKVPENPKVNGKQQPAVTTPKMMQQTKTTPVAVRHLPVASQKEYLRLVERMRLLEKKKNLTAKTASPPVAASKGSAAEKPMPAKNGFHQPAKAALVPTSTSSKATMTPGKPQAKTASTKASNQKTKQSQPPRESRLKAFENSFAKIGSSMITNLDKSLQMVEEAKKSKIIRLRCSQRLNELYAEMQSVKQAARQEELKLSRIQPEIQASHEIIISLKQKRHKLRAAALDLGRGLRGDDYRLRDDGKEDISLKSKQLTKEIRLYNSIVKYDDLNKLTEVEKEPKTVIENGVEREDIPAEQPIELKETSSPSETAVPAIVETEKEGQPEPEPTAVETPDNQAQDEAIEAPKQDSPGPYTISTMRTLCEENTEPEPRSASSHYLPAYQTPMPRNYNSHLDVHATICPFDLMGRCEDADCSYLHLARPDAPSELPKTTNLSPIH